MESDNYGNDVGKEAQWGYWRLMDRDNARWISELRKPETWVAADLRQSQHTYIKLILRLPTATTAHDYGGKK
jgi:hypothetical protein